MLRYQHTEKLTATQRMDLKYQQRQFRRIQISQNLLFGFLWTFRDKFYGEILSNIGRELYNRQILCLYQQLQIFCIGAHQGSSTKPSRRWTDSVVTAKYNEHCNWENWRSHSDQSCKKFHIESNGKNK